MKGKAWKLRWLIFPTVIAIAILCIPLAQYAYEEWQWKRNMTKAQNWEALSLKEKSSLVTFFDGGYAWAIFRRVKGDIDKKLYDLDVYRTLLSAKDFRVLVKAVNDVRMDEILWQIK